ncbi:unnamed protein product [Didymodactylos carnosus]|uniref:Uncharacterized protein n=1 Tax=Didymodactylos carnosus TaxID=1234261 RepID=A0A813ZPL3_9BILA|nr:unnamed protein product [Didymodactylos carnosus]CAF1439483.1 unnamed protein product [Didymodactylos carnosus]CAF3683837.1 unnamed protein product [Didymodactylos carnosus]CAF4235975.1 unnamed protein product [Didymodactylos carnosus]
MNTLKTRITHVLNQTIINSTTQIPTTTITELTTSSPTSPIYDAEGAAIYIAVILIWYSTGLAMMLFLQVRPRNYNHQFSFDMDRTEKNRKHLHPFTYYKNFQENNNTKQILNELKDPVRRQKLWKIYFGAKTNEHPQYYQTVTAMDSVTINRIKRKLADIHKTSDDGTSSPDIIPTFDYNTTSPVRPTLTPDMNFLKRFTSFRRSASKTPSNCRSPPPPLKLIRRRSQNDVLLEASELQPLTSVNHPLGTDSLNRENSQTTNESSDTTSETNRLRIASSNNPEKNVQSLTNASATVVTVHEPPVIKVSSATPSTTNNSSWFGKKRNNNFFSRFVIEKVSDTNNLST